jgi:hypothetical protein
MPTSNLPAASLSPQIFELDRLFSLLSERKGGTPGTAAGVAGGAHTWTSALGEAGEGSASTKR